ncbi:MAG: AI-2E family transporter [Bacteroidota bacterium]
MPLSDKQFHSLKKVIIALTILAIIIYLAYLFSEIIAMLIISLLIAMIFSPIVDFLEKRGLQRFLSVLAVFILTGILIFSLLSFLLPKIINQFNELGLALTPQNIKSLVGDIEKALTSFFPFLNSTQLADKIVTFFQNIIFGWVNNISNILSSIVSIVAILIIVPFMTFFLLKDNRVLMKGIVNVMPNRFFEVSYSVIKKISQELSRFVRGWILDAFLVGLMSGVGLALLGIQNAASIGFIAGAGHLIPYFGPIIGGLPAIIISLIQFGDFSMLPNILLLFIIVYTFDNGYIQPNIFSKNTDLHPLVIILLILIGNEVMGIFGMLIAVPAATVVRTATHEIFNGYKNYKIIHAN